MKLNQYKIVFICLAFLCLNGCTLIDDFLEVDPSKSTRKTIQTAEQLDMVLAVMPASIRKTGHYVG